MKIEEIRSSFTVYVIASDLERQGGVTEVLGLAGYVVATFSELTSAFSEFYSNPPHFLLFDGEETNFDLKKTVKQVTAQLPESHIFLLTSIEQREAAIEFLEMGVYDLLLLPLVSPTELTRALDRAAERDYFMYLNERLMQEAPAPTDAPASPPPAAPSETAPLAVDGPPPLPREGLVPPEAAANDLGYPTLASDVHLTFARQVFAPTLDECVRVFMTASARLLDDCPVVFFRYIANRRVLLAGEGENLGEIELGGVGINLNQASEGFRAIQLREPMRIEPFVAMVKDIFGIDDFFASPVEGLGETHGVVCFLRPPPREAVAEVLLGWRDLLNKAVTLAEAEKRLHIVNTKDVHTEVLNRQTFLGKIHEEISRSRRTRMPVALVLIAIDQYGQLSSAFGLEEAQLVLRTAARILEKHSRTNDVLGRTGVDEFGLLLPHTHRDGAMVKAERLRKILESADFSKVLAKFPHLTVSIGISVYPTIVRDAEELLQSADDALFQVRSTGNQTCIALPAENFQPDFIVEAAVISGLDATDEPDR